MHMMVQCTNGAVLMMAVHMSTPASGTMSSFFFFFLDSSNLYTVVPKYRWTMSSLVAGRSLMDLVVKPCRCGRGAPDRGLLFFSSLFSFRFFSFSYLYYYVLLFLLIVSISSCNHIIFPMSSLCTPAAPSTFSAEISMMPLWIEVVLPLNCWCISPWQEVFKECAWVVKTISPSSPCTNVVKCPTQDHG